MKIEIKVDNCCIAIEDERLSGDCGENSFNRITELVDIAVIKIKELLKHDAYEITGELSSVIVKSGGH